MDKARSYPKVPCSNCGQPLEISVRGNLCCQKYITQLEKRVKELEKFIVGEAKAGSDTAIGLIREERE